MKTDNFISKRKILLITVGVLAILLTLIIAVFCLPDGEDTPPSPTDLVVKNSMETTGKLADTEGTSSNITETATNPDHGEDKPQNPTSNSAEATTEPTILIKPPSEELTCDMFAVFSGEYVEDGSDKAVENVAAILVTNQTNRFLELGSLTYDIDGTKAVFNVTGLPAGRSAWVMEANGVSADHNSIYTLVDHVLSFRDDVVNTTDKIKIKYNGDMLQATNCSGKTLDNVVVYYKTLHTDDNFFGGITYTINFGTMEPGASVEKIAGHYQVDKSEIVRISWQESQTDDIA